MEWSRKDALIQGDQVACGVPHLQDWILVEIGSLDLKAMPHVLLQPTVPRTGNSEVRLRNTAALSSAQEGLGALLRVVLIQMENSLDAEGASSTALQTCA